MPVGRFAVVPAVAVRGRRCDEHELTEVAGIDEVLRWVEEHRDGRAVELFVRRTDGQGRGLIRLLGR